MHNVSAEPYQNRYWQISTKVTSDHEAATEVAFGDSSIVHWSSSPFSWQWNAIAADSTDGSDFPSDVAGDAIDAAFDQWQNVSTATITFSKGDSTSITNADDNINVLFWESDPDSLDILGLDDSKIAVTIVTNKNGAYDEYKDVDICFNAEDYRWTATEGDISNTIPKVVDNQSIAVHEIGHMLGIGHSTYPYTPAPVMRSGYPWDISRHTLDADDEFAVSYLYGGNIIDTIGISDDKYFDWDITIKSAGRINTNADMYFDDDVDLVVEGYLNVRSNGATFQKKSGATNWGGINVKSGGTFDVDDFVTIRDATTGLRIENSSGFDNSSGANRVTIKDCSDWGMYVYNVSPTIKNVYLDNNEGTGVKGGIKVSGGSADPTFDRVAIDNGDYGMYIYNTTANMVRSDIYTSNSDHSIRLDLSSADIDLDYGGDPVGYGNNKIMPDTTYSKKAIYRYNCSSPISAVGNWWGMSPVVNSTLFDPSTGVTTTNAHTDSTFTSGVYKPVIFSRSLVETARDYEANGEYDEAYNIYKELFEKEESVSGKKKLLKSLLRVKEITRENIHDLNLLLETDKNLASGEYAAFLDYLICDLSAKTGKYAESARMFEEKLAEYVNTPMELEMLCRLATLYGNNLDNPAKAREYAEKAESINAGYGLLDVAYDACGITYDPSMHVDTTASLMYPEKPVTEGGSHASATPAVSITPNPANPTTTITYTLAEPGTVRLTVYSVTGQKVETLVDAAMTAGAHSVLFDGSNLASGVYFYRLEEKGFAKSGKMLLVK